MIDLTPYEECQNFGIHCPNRCDAERLVEHINNNYPQKRHPAIDMLLSWDVNKEDTIYYPHFMDNGYLNYGRVGGHASRYSQIVEFSSLISIQDLPIEQSEIPIEYFLGV